jgi:sugar phosphate isomerase/epimerase
LGEARVFAARLREAYGLAISSMQSIWYGRRENIFASKEEREALLDYTRQAIEFASALGCGNLVFGCPKNRTVPEGLSDYIEIAGEFFAKIADCAEQGGVVIALEANPPIYGTNFINTTAEAFSFVKDLARRGLRVNVDLGTLIENGEDWGLVVGEIELVNHIHISEPGLGAIEKRGFHERLGALPFEGYASIEMKTQENVAVVKGAVEYISGLLRR